MQDGMNTRSAPSQEAFYVNAANLPRRLRWIMLAAIVFDISMTFLGQPPSYWTQPTTVDEGNRLFHLVMSQGWGFTLLVDAVYLAGSFVLVSFLPWRAGLMLLLALVFGHFFGGSTWLIFRFKLGAQAFILYGALLSALMVTVGLRPEKKTAQQA